MHFIPLGLGDVALSIVLIGAVVLLSLWNKLGLERDLVIGTVRTFVQLLAVGHILRFVFSLDHPWPVILVVLVMMAVAVYNGVRRQSAFYRSFSTV